MSTTSLDDLRIGLNLALAAGQIAATTLLFRDGFTPMTGPIPSPGPTPIEPAGYAFAIWGVIYLGSLAYAVFLALPENQSDPTLRRIGWLTIVGFAGCIGWLLAAKHGPVIATVPVIIVMLMAIGWAFVSAARVPSPSPAFAAVVVVPLAIYAGWLSVAAFANLSEVLPSYGFERFGLSASTWTVLMLATASALALALMAASHGSTPYALTILWALVAIIVANLDREANGAVIGAASIAALVVLATWSWYAISARVIAS